MILISKLLSYFNMDKVSEDVQELAGQSPQAVSQKKKKSSFLSNQSECFNFKVCTPA